MYQKYLCFQTRDVTGFDEHYSVCVIYTVFSGKGQRNLSALKSICYTCLILAGLQVFISSCQWTSSGIHPGQIQFEVFGVVEKVFASLKISFEIINHMSDKHNMDSNDDRLPT